MSDKYLTAGVAMAAVASVAGLACAFSRVKEKKAALEAKKEQAAPALPAFLTPPADGKYILAPQQLFIDNKFVPSESADVTFYDVINPSTEELLAKVPNATAADVEKAYQAAAGAFDSWSALSGKERAVHMRNIAAVVRKNRDRLALLESMNMGKPGPQTLVDISTVAGCFDYFASRAEHLDYHGDRSIEIPDAAVTGKLRKLPIGVVGVIVPWNFPLMMAAWKLAPILGAGCTAVIKPSELSPLTLLELGLLFQEAGLPAGVVNIVTGIGAITGEAIIHHKGFAKLAFTGSVMTGSKVMAAAAENITDVLLELGGKSAVIACDDVNVDNAVDWTLFGIFLNSGQVCSATSRLILHEKIYDKFIARLVEGAKAVAVGDVSAVDNINRVGFIGPLVSETQRKRVDGFVQSAIAEGATVLLGGGPVEEKKGFFYQPTLLEVTPEMKVWKEEIFGPVLSIVKFKTDEEAINLANNSEYGLAGGVLCLDRSRAHAIGKRLRIGQLWVNCCGPAYPQLTWGGFKKSGAGGRELGPEGLDVYLEIQAVIDRLDASPLGYFPLPAQK